MRRALSELETARRWIMAAGLLLAMASGAVAGDWPQWRGPNRDGISPEDSGWPKGWPPKRLWGGNVGAGCTSPVMAGGRLYVMGWSGKGRPKDNPVGTDTVHCFDAATGRQIWKQSYPSRYQGRLRTGDTGGYGGPCSTPTFDAAGGFLYTLGVDGELRCWNAADGRPVWKKNLHAKYKIVQRPDAGGGKRDFGFTSSPLVRHDLVIVEVGDARGTVIAFDAKSGRQRWSSEYALPAGHSSGPVPMKVGGIDCLAVLSLRELVVMRVDRGHEGRTLATFKWQTEYSCNIPTPTAVGSRVILTSGYNRSRTALVEITAKGARQVWRSRQFAIVSTPVVRNDRVYVVNGRVRCLDLADGATKWRGGSFGHGSCLATADDKIIVFGNGRLALLDAAKGRNKYRELAAAHKVVPGTCYPHVALADGIVCVKDRDGNLACYSVGGPDGSATNKTP